MIDNAAQSTLRLERHWHGGLRRGPALMRDLDRFSQDVVALGSLTAQDQSSADRSRAVGRVSLKAEQGRVAITDSRVELELMGVDLEVVLDRESRELRLNRLPEVDTHAEEASRTLVKVAVDDHGRPLDVIFHDS